MVHQNEDWMGLRGTPVAQALKAVDPSQTHIVPYEIKGLPGFRQSGSRQHNHIAAPASLMLDRVIQAALDEWFPSESEGRANGGASGP